MSTNNHAILTVQQIAERWQCDQRVVLSAINSGRLRAFKLNPAAKRPTWRIPLDAVLSAEVGPVRTEKPVRRRRRNLTTKNYFARDTASES